MGRLLMADSMLSQQEWGGDDCKQECAGRCMQAKMQLPYELQPPRSAKICT